MEVQEKLIPIKLLIGWIPKVSSRNAHQYVIGIAEKHCQGLKDAGYLVLPFEGGWAYEIQEGGAGKAYLPAILKAFTQFRKSGEEDLSKAERFVIETAHRNVQVELLSEGLTAINLPESSLANVSAKLVPEGALHSMLPERRQVLFIGAAVMMAGVLTFAASLIWKYQPQISPSPHVVSYPKKGLPFDQWTTVTSTSLPPGAVISKLEYANGKWDVVKGTTTE